MAQKKKSVKPTPAPAPPPIQVDEARLSSIHFMPALALLQSRKPPAIPAAFLLDDTAFVNQYKSAQSGSASSLQPGFYAYGWRFWSRCSPGLAPADCRRALVPIAQDLASIVDNLALPDGVVTAQVLVYPWGLSIVIDVTLRGPLTLAAAVKRLMDIRSQRSIAWKMGTDANSASPAQLAAEIRKRLAPLLYGTVPLENPAEPLSIVTVTDGSGVDPNVSVVADGTLHRALEGLISWNGLWATTQAPAGSLTSSAIPTKAAPPGHILYGGGKSRVIWFPSWFSSAAKGAPTLSCFHQNLTAGSLHTDALCLLAHDAAAELSAHGTLDDFSATYGNCAKLTGGLLGRLHGKKPGYKGAKPDIYRSGSIRSQILDYKDDVNQLRGFYPTMPPLDT